eukprot:scaffold115569_cov22-Tisochrysis_lutea.AAC.1
MGHPWVASTMRLFPRDYRIATARAAISDMTPRKDEDISVQELLAEGSFGKVYRGRWRGADVAVKIIMVRPRAIQCLLRYNLLPYVNHRGLKYRCARILTHL